MKSAPREVQQLDVRPLMARGEEPFARIMQTIAALAPGEGLALTTPFLPAPLIERLQSEGFAARPERRADGGWRTEFWREEAP